MNNRGAHAARPTSVILQYNPNDFPLDCDDYRIETDPCAQPTDLHWETMRASYPPRHEPE